jgi:para-nitrobenzyl esterase
LVRERRTVSRDARQGPESIGQQGRIIGMDSIANTNAGQVRGVNQNGVHIFRGVPYGAPMKGALRFHPATKPQPWTGVRDALAYGPTAPQASMAEAGGGGSAPAEGPGAGRVAEFMAFLHGMAGDEPAQDEDCLVLNVWTAGLARDRKRPVFFFVHGGAFTSGSGSWKLYDGVGLASRDDAVVVTINHRLGALGFLHLAAFGGSEYASSGNVGMLDIVLALEWVRDNIENFGGDPNRVLVFGSSGGASKTSTLLGMPAAKGLLHRANLMSGPMIRCNTADRAALAAERLMKRLDIAPKDFRKLHDVPAQILVREAEHIGAAIGDGLAGNAGADAFMPLQPVVDGLVLPAHPMDPTPSPYGVDVPVLIGSTRDDMTLIMLAAPWFGLLDQAGLKKMGESFFGPMTDKVLAEYRREKPDATPTDTACQIVTDRTMWVGAIDWAERRAAAGRGPVYVYRFDFETPAMGGIAGAAHGGDIPFAMNNYDASSMAGDRPDNPEMAKIMSDTWVSFVATGNPNNPAIPQWDTYDAKRRATMLFDVPSRVENDPRANIRVALTEALKVPA